MATKRIRIAVVAAFVAVAALAALPAVADPGDPPITGEVFRDYNADGIRGGLDPGFADYTVTAYAADGTSAVGTVNVDGTYSIDVSTLDPGSSLADIYRVEFTGLPGYMTSGPDGVDSGTTVQFVQPGGVANLGVGNPAQYCDPSPDLATTCYIGGSVANDGPSVLSFIYDAGITSTTSNQGLADTPHVDHANDDQVGPVRGLAFHRATDTILAAAYAKRHTAYPITDGSGPDRIYLVPRDGSASTVFFTAEAGADNHDYGNLIADAGFWDEVGKTGWGDIDFSDDEGMLYASNMGDRLIYVVPVVEGGGTISAGTATTIDLAGLTNVTTECADGDWVPGAIKGFDGLIYLGVTCTAETSQLRSDIQGLVYAYDPGAGTATQVAAFPLDYDRDNITGAGTPAEFFPWTDTEAFAPPGQPSAAFGQVYYPQPWVLDIEFDESNNMLIGVSDRAGDQFGNDNGAAGAGNNEGVTAGDTLRLLPSGGSWTLGALDDDYYDAERYTLTGGTHSETSLGSLTVWLGSGEVVSNAFDPAPVGGSVTDGGGNVLFPQSFRSGGLIWMSHADGSRTRSYQIFGLDEPGTFGKAAGIGDVELLCNAAPVEIGNFVWLDLNEDGIQDPGETPIEGVTVNLYDDGGTLLATTVTDIDGEYLFNDGNVPSGLQQNTDYIIRLDNPSDYTGVGPLVGYQPTGTDQGSNDLADSDATTVAGFAEISVTTGGPGANDHTLDFGFVVAGSYRLGNLVWNDANDNGVADPSEAPIAGVTVELLDAAGVVIATTVTGADGKYLFENLDAGDYSVRIPGGQPVLTGFVSSGIPNPSADDDTDNDNNGVFDGANWESGVVTLGEGSGMDEPTGEIGGLDGVPDEDGSWPDATSNLTVDFGFVQVPVLELGNLVFWDVNNDGQYEPGAGDTPIAGVTVQLTDVGSGAVIASTETDADGIYLFTGLAPGDYIASIPVAELTLGGSLQGFYPSDGPGVSSDPNDDVDSNSDGVLQSDGSVSSGVISLQPGTEPTDEEDESPTGLDDDSSNLSVDFGFYSLTLGDQIWLDADNDGVIDPDEDPIPGVSVSLLDALGNPVLGLDGQPMTDVTDSNGNYEFTGLPEGTYIVVVDASNFELGGALHGTISSTGNNGADGLAPDPDDDNESDDNGNPQPDGSVAAAPVTIAATEEPSDAVGNTNLTVDFGFIPAGAIGDFVWSDEDGDGIQDPNEPGLEGYAVWLVDADTGELLAEDVTDANGNYLFEGLPPGNYVVVFQISESDTLSPANVGPDATDSDADVTTGSSDLIELEIGEVDLTIDAGIVVGDLPQTGADTNRMAAMALLLVMLGTLMVAYARPKHAFIIRSRIAALFAHAFGARVRLPD